MTLRRLMIGAGPGMRCCRGRGSFGGAAAYPLRYFFHVKSTFPDSIVVHAAGICAMSTGGVLIGRCEHPGQDKCKCNFLRKGSQARSGTIRKRQEARADWLRSRRIKAVESDRTGREIACVRPEWRTALPSAAAIQRCLRATGRTDSARIDGQSNYPMARYRSRAPVLPQ